MFAHVCVSGNARKHHNTQCKNADIPDAPETSFRRWQKKDQAAFDCEPTKDTAESHPIRHRDQVLGLLEQVVRDRDFTRKTIVLHEPELQSTHKGVTRPFRILSVWYQELKDRYLEVIKLPGVGGEQVGTGGGGGGGATRSVAGGPC